MPIPGTVPVTSKIAPTDPADTYATHDVTWEMGGWRPVANDADRDSIPTQRRKAGMAVYVRATGKLQVLGDDLITWSDVTTS